MELKFRAYDKNEKAMIDWKALSWVFINALSQPHIEVMQFTGLLDKNGKEIYKSDIVKVDKDIIELLSGEEISKVRYINGGFYAGEVFIGHLVDMYYVLRGEIIGNIYENPNLLKA